MIQLDNAVERYKKIILSEMIDNDITCWLAGGAIRDYFMGIPINTDYDMFFPNEENYKRAYDYFIENNGKIKWESDNGCKVVYNNKTFDLVKKYFDNPQLTIEAFDFTVSMFAVDSEKVYYGETTFIDLAKRQLMFNKITYPASTLSRAFRYYKKGFKMCNGEMKKLFMSINEYNVPSEEQITESQQKNTTNAEDNTEEISGDFDVFFVGID